MIAWLAVRIDTANIRQATHVMALAIDAGFLIGAVVVMTTALYAAVVVTDESVQAFIVSCTFRLWLVSEADHVGVSTMTRQARTISVMVDGAAEGVPTTCSVNTARILTDAINACLVGCTPLVRLATIDTLVALAHMAKGTVSVHVAFLHRLGWNLPAFNFGITHEASLAGTDWSMGGNDAKCINAAGSGNMAEVLTLAVVARLAGQALVVRAAAVNAATILADLAKGTLAVSLATFFPHFSAMNLRISSQARQAEANRAMICSTTVGINATDTCETARVLTAVANACFVVSTGIVGATRVDTGSLLTDAADRTISVMEAEFLPRHSALDVGVATES